MCHTQARYGCYVSLHSVNLKLPLCIVFISSGKVAGKCKWKNAPGGQPILASTQKFWFEQLRLGAPTTPSSSGLFWDLVATRSPAGAGGSGSTSRLRGQGNKRLPRARRTLERCVSGPICTTVILSAPAAGADSKGPNTGSMSEASPASAFAEAAL